MTSTIIGPWFVTSNAVEVRACTGAIGLGLHMFDRQLGAQLVKFRTPWLGSTQKLVAIKAPIIALDRAFSGTSL